MYLLRLAALATVATLGCSAPNFKVADVDDASAEAGDTAIADSTPPLDGTPCPPPPPGGDLYVDSTSTAAAPTGAASCPFRTIREGLAGAPAGGKRTVRVKGQVGGRTYNETGALVVRDQVSLVSDGFGNVVIQSDGGACAGAGPQCVLQVDRGGTLDGFNVISTKAGVTLISLSATGGAGGATVRNVKASGATEGAFAILVNNGATIGPQVESTLNVKAAGLQIYGAGAVRIQGAGNRFDFNLVGIAHEGGSGLVIADGATANKNARSGVRIATAPAIVNNLNGLSATGNGDAGLEVHAGSLVLRNAILNVGNRVGAIISAGPGVTLDLGQLSSAGKNIFATAFVKNLQAGICFNAAAVTINAHGNKWNQCSPAPSTLSISGTCADNVSGYADIVFRSPGSYTISTEPCDS